MPGRAATPPPKGPMRANQLVVNQRHLDGVAKRLREHGAEFEPAEAGAENEDALFHGLLN